MSGASKRARLLKLGTEAFRIATEKYVQGFAMRSNPVSMGPTREFPGVDMDRIYEVLRARGGAG